MAELINVSPEAKLEAVRRQLAQRRPGPVVIELPDGWTELDNTARMRLLQRQAQAQRINLALITRDEATRKAASVVGIPTFLRTGDVPSRRWQMRPLLPLINPRRPAAGLPEPPPWRREEIVERTARPNHHHARQKRIRAEARYRLPAPWWLRLLSPMVLGVIVIALLYFFTLYVLPAATITLTPGRDAIAVTVPLIADANLDVADLDANLLPARLLEANIEEIGVIATTGSQQKPTERATGSVDFSNLGSTPVDIPSGTIVSTSTGTPVNFRTTQQARVEGGVGQRVSVPIEAVDPGVSGNVRANTINTVNGALRFRLRVSNPGGTFSGGSQLVPVVTQQDRDNLLAQTLAAAEAKAYDALAVNLEPGEWLPPESVQTLIISQAFDKFNDDEGSELSLTLRVLAQGSAMSEAQTNEAMLAALRRAVPTRGLLVADSVSMQRLPGSVAVGRRVEFTMTAAADYVVPIDPADVKSTIAGLTPADAIQAVQARWPLARVPEIYRDPEWLGTLPPFGSRIQVRVEYVGAQDAQ